MTKIQNPSDAQATAQCAARSQESDPLVTGLVHEEFVELDSEATDGSSESPYDLLFDHIRLYGELKLVRLFYLQSEPVPDLSAETNEETYRALHRHYNEVSDRIL